jgi:hypothetical protein
MKLRQMRKPEPPKKEAIGVEDYIKVIQSILQDIEDFDEEHQHQENYEGVLTDRSAKRLKKILPEEYKKLNLE